jgi:GNAT superfamily N-acetyltransferase
VTTPELQLRTLYVLDELGRMKRTQEPGANRPPLFALIRGGGTYAWAVRDDVPDEISSEIDELVRIEPADKLERDPMNAEGFRSLLGGSRVESGPAFEFSSSVGRPEGVVQVQDPAQLTGEIADLADEIDGRAPVLAILHDGRAVSVCHCARRSDKAAEAGLYTLEDYRGQGLGPRVTAAWCHAIRESGRIPLYSTSWRNAASRSVAKKLDLRVYALDWSLYE